MSDRLPHLRTALADRYTIERELGSGGMATVYLAHDVRHERHVAVKVLRPELAAALGADRFLREITITANLNHPHILPLLDSGEVSAPDMSGAYLFYVMPYVEGESLRDRLDREKQLPIADALKIASEVADALGFAHEHNVIHRDIKPENILLEAKHAVVADFGVARAIAEAGETQLTETGIAIGTPAYLSPEQATGERELDGRSDVYALGCVLYEMLAGEPPFHGPTAQSIATKHLTLPPPLVTDSRPTVPAEVAEAVSTALAKAPADRFATAGRFADVLDTALLHISAPTAQVKQRAPARWLGAAAVVAIVALGLALWKPWASDEVAAESAGWAWTILADVEGSAAEDIRDLVRSLLASDIDASGTLLTLPEDQLQRGLERAMKPDTTRLTLPVAKELAERGRIATVFAPVLDRAGNTYALTVRVLQTETDSVLATERVTAADDDALIPASREAVERLTPVVAAWMGGEARELRSNPPVTSSLMDPPITSSLAAFRKRMEAGRAQRVGRYRDAVRLLRESLEIDPDFAAAWSTLGMVYANSGFPDSATYARREALKRPERLTEQGRLLLQARLDDDWDVRLQISEQRYRETGRATNSYAIALADGFGRFEEAVAVYEEMAEQRPFGLGALEQMNWVNYLLALGRVAEAEDRAASLEGTAREVPVNARIALRKADWETAERLAMEVARDPVRDARWRSDALWNVASARAARGRIREAVAALHEMIETNEQSGRVPGYRRSHLNLLILTVAANLQPQPFHFERLRADTTQRFRRRAIVILGLWAAEVGDSTSARSYLESLPALELGEFDAPTSQDALVATLQARLASQRGDWEQAIRLLQPVTGELSPRDNARTRLPNWVMAEAQEALGNLDAAARLYAGIAAGYRFGLGEVSGFGLTYSFAHRKAALLNTQLEEYDRALDHWMAFLDAFTDPDPEYAWMVEEARTELERVGRGR